MAYVCGLAHDLLDSKFSSSGEIDEFEMDFLNLLRSEEGFMTEKEIANMLRVIKSIGYKMLIREDFDSSSLPAEYKCVQDADLLDAIGAIGISRCYSFGGKKNRKLFGVTRPVRPPGQNIDAITYAESQTNTETSNVDHFFEKLLTIQSKMQTVHGKVLATKRHDFMIEFLKQLDEELAESNESAAGSVAHPAALFDTSVQGTAFERASSSGSIGSRG